MRSEGLVIDTIVCLTLVKWETVSGRFGGYLTGRAKGFELLSLAETVNDPERRADMLRYARMWMNLSEPMPDLPSAYQLPRRH